MLLAIAMHATEKGNDYKYYHRGVFVEIDFSPGTALNGKHGNNYGNTSYGTNVALGYRFTPLFAFALGTGAHAYSNKTLTCDDTVLRKIENNCLPAYVRLRTDFSDKEVAPFLEWDLGYAFMDMYTREEPGRVKYSTDSFTNGRSEYLPMDDSYIQYGMSGLFSSLDLGVSLHVIGRTRMNIGLTAGIHQVFIGTSFKMTDSEVLDFGRVDYLTDSKELVRTVGTPDFKDSLEPFVRVKMGFSF